jgi:fused signal recognition particle receptor
LSAFFNRFQASLKKTREGVFGKINRLFTAKRKIDDNLLEELEELLISGDVGIDTSLHIIEKIREKVSSQGYQNSDELEGIIKSEIKDILLTMEEEKKDIQPKIILVVGVNGTGKTTSIAKLAKRYMQDNKKVLLAAADTFRAAAIEQLSTWAERVGCDIIKHQSGADPSAVAYDAVSAAIARKIDYLIIDTAGRLHTKVNLMQELDKIIRVIRKLIPEAPHEVILVLDANTGQNAISQAKEFKQTAEVDSIFIAKLDGTAKGGVILAVNKELAIPVKYVGTGEKVDDMEVFDKDSFVDALFLKE